MKYCNIKRDMFNMFVVKSCNNCQGVLTDEKIVSGDIVIYIYYLNRYCEEVMYTEKEIANSLILKKFLTESYKNDELVLWINIKERSKIDRIIELMSCFEVNVHILVY